ncbi:hypothetical protein NPIL_485401, partial [Nephila pilipes]
MRGSFLPLAQMQQAGHQRSCNSGSSRTPIDVTCEEIKPPARYFAVSLDFET